MWVGVWVGVGEVWGWLRGRAGGGSGGRAGGGAQAGGLWGCSGDSGEHAQMPFRALPSDTPNRLDLPRSTFGGSTLKYWSSLSRLSRYV